jgi:hypothetical protein
MDNQVFKLLICMACNLQLANVPLNCCTVPTA